jgi:hypothetical protein
MEWECLPRDNTLLFHYNILTLYASPVYSYGRPMPPESLLFTPLVSSLREIELGGFAPTRHYGFILFRHNIHTLYA